MEEITSQRLSLLRRIRESQRESEGQARESEVMESSVEDTLEEDMFVENPMMR
jgi:hypothetical protein